MQTNGDIEMLRLSSLLYTFIAATLAGIGVIIVLVAGLDTMMPIVVAAAVGALVAMPISWLIARRLYNSSLMN